MSNKTAQQVYENTRGSNSPENREKRALAFFKASDFEKGLEETFNEAIAESPQCCSKCHTWTQNDGDRCGWIECPSHSEPPPLRDRENK